MTAKKGNFFIMQRDYASNMVFNSKEPWCEPRCWENLIELANFERSTFPYEKKYHTIQRGQVATVLSALAKRWRWKYRSQVRDFLKKLELHQMIEVDTSKNFTLITIVNYDRYQFPSKVDEPTEINKGTFETHNRTKAQMEFQKLKAAYPSGMVDVKNAMQIFGEQRLYEKTAEIISSVETWKGCDNWQRGYAPKLSNFLADELYTQQPPKAKEVKNEEIPF